MPSLSVQIPFLIPKSFTWCTDLCCLQNPLTSADIPQPFESQPNQRNDQGVRLTIFRFVFASRFWLGGLATLVCTSREELAVQFFHAFRSRIGRSQYTTNDFETGQIGEFQCEL